MRSLRTFAAVLALSAALAVSALAAEESLTLAGLNVTMWSRPSQPAARQPIIIFSHGFHGCATQSRFLMAALASAGYIVFAPDHRDSACGEGGTVRPEGADAPFRNPAAWSEASFRDRAEDIRRLIAALKSDDTFDARLDWSRLGLVGHSLGGYTVLGLAGAWPSWKLDGIKAVLALSPYIQPFLVHHTLGDISVPVMFQGGTLDYGITPSLHRGGGAYDMCPAPKYLVEFSRASHLAWTDAGKAAHEPIVSYALAFMDHYVKGQPDPKRLSRVLPGVSHYRYSSEIGSVTGAKPRK